MIDILIPTYNRSEFVKKNILLLDQQITGNNLEAYFRILVSDNHSEDDTWDNLESLKGQVKTRLHTFHQSENIGLERNAIFLLQKAERDYVMYLGDDDYLPEGYLQFVIEVITRENASCVIPGITALFLDGTTKVSRDADFSVRRFEKGFSSVCNVSHFGHQLSGVVVQSKSLYQKYVAAQQYRNIYPFIFFVAYCALNGVTFYAPKFKVLVTNGNSKDWAYDDSGLLTEIFKNYYILFPKSEWKRFRCCVAFVARQRWRLRISKNVLNAVKAMVHISKDPSVDVSLKLYLPVLACYLYCHSAFRKLISLIGAR